jgi:hypothetical protein
MQEPDPPVRFGATDRPRLEHVGAVGAPTHDVDPGPVLRFAQELGRLLGAHLARAGIPAGDPANPQVVPPRARRHRDP